MRYSVLGLFHVIHKQWILAGADAVVVSSAKHWDRRSS